jgi:hypothetical protein
MNKQVHLTTALALAVLSSFGGEAVAQGLGAGAGLDVETVPSQRIRGQRVFSAKFLCTIPTNPLILPPGPLVPGIYRTAINIHNPDPVRPVKFTKKALLTPGPVGEPIPETLGPNAGFELDCENIQGLAGVACIPEGCFLKGFVVITTEGPLDVVGVYTFKNVEAAGP